MDSPAGVELGDHTYVTGRSDADAIVPPGYRDQEGSVYDVLYVDQESHSRMIASGLGRDSAVTLARAEARRRRVGRMFLAGSEPSPRGELVLIVESHRTAA